MALSDNGSIYTAIETICATERLNLVPITTPASSPQSNGMSEAFVNTLRRDYINGADLSSAAVVLDQVPHWFADDNAVAPKAHAALGPGLQVAARVPRGKAGKWLSDLTEVSHERGTRDNAGDFNLTPDAS